MIICRIVIFEMTIYAVFLVDRLPAAEPDRSNGNPQQSEHPVFCNTVKTVAKRKIPDGQIHLPKSGSAFCRDANGSCKRQKMVARAGIEPTTNCLEGSCSIH